jgi:hypothetical protein
MSFREVVMELADGHREHGMLHWLNIGIEIAEKGVPCSTYRSTRSSVAQVVLVHVLASRIVWKAVSITERFR